MQGVRDGSDSGSHRSHQARYCIGGFLMRHRARHFSAPVIIGLLTSTVGVVQAERDERTTAATIEEGKQPAFNRTKVNCLTRHQMEGGDRPGNIGPLLITLEARYPDPETLWNRVYDACPMDPHILMPTFRPHRILSEEVSTKIVEYIDTLSIKG